MFITGLAVLSKSRQVGRWVFLALLAPGPLLSSPWGPAMDERGLQKKGGGGPKFCIRP